MIDGKQSMEGQSRLASHWNSCNTCSSAILLNVQYSLLASVCLFWPWPSAHAISWKCCCICCVLFCSVQPCARALPDAEQQTLAQTLYVKMVFWPNSLAGVEKFPSTVSGCCMVYWCRATGVTYVTSCIHHHSVSVYSIVALHCVGQILLQCSMPEG